MENWKSTNDYNKQNFVAFALFLKRLVQAFQYLGYTADLQSSTLMKKAKEKVPRNILLKWTEHTVTLIETPTTLNEFQKQLEVQAHVYDKMNCETFHQNNIRRNNFNSSGRLNNSDSHERNLSTQSSGFPAQPTNRNQSTTISSSGTPKPPSAPLFPPLNNANQPKRSCKKCRGNHILATCPDYQKCSPSQRFDIVSKSNICSNCLSNKHKKQNCPSTKRCQTCSGYHHTTLHDPAKIIKRPPAAFATSNSTGTNVTNQENQPVKQQCEPGSNNNASVPSKSQKSRYRQSFANKNQNQFQHANLNNANQNFSLNHLQSTPKEWFEQLQLISVSFLNGKRAFDTYALIDPGSQFTFILDKITEFLALPCEDQEATTLQYPNTEHDMPLSKISEQVTVAPSENLDQSFKFKQLIARLV